MARILRIPRPKRIDCANCRARAHGLSNAAPEQIASLIASHSSGQRELTAGHDLFSPGEPCEAIYNVIDGWVALYELLKDGRRQILQFALPGAVLGFHPTEGAVAPYGAQMLTNATVCVISQTALESLSTEYPEIGMRLAWMIARDRSLAFDHLTSIGRRSARERVARLLLELFVRYRARWPRQVTEEMPLPLTQEHIGDATGLTGVHVNRVLGELRKDAILQFHYRRLAVFDSEKLLEVAGVDQTLWRSWVRAPAPTVVAVNRLTVIKLKGHRSVKRCDPSCRGMPARQAG
ncbi:MULTISPECIES: Crp/Fnr family transcriptional regulator [Alphaproteobacteria]|uniref:Crp/Fnr family transcriptional regulator n=1 Tax=Alphaproteobacteria TaxID=28211 RepID=UPI003265749C